MGSHEHSTESQLLDHNHSVQHSRDATGLFTRPQRIWLCNGHQQTGPKMKGKKLTSICRIDKPALSAYCITDALGGRKILPPLLLLISYKTSEHRHCSTD